MRQMPCSVRRNRSASRSASSPTSSPAGMRTPRSITDILQLGSAAHLGVRQDHGIFDVAVGMNMDAGEQQGTTDRGAGNDAASGNQRGDRLAAPLLLVVNELGGRRDFGMGPDRPGSVVKIELGQDIGEVDIGRPIGIQRSHVPPIAARILVRSDAGAAELMRHRPAVFDNIRDDVLAEIMARIRIIRRRAAARQTGIWNSKT